MTENIKWDFPLSKTKQIRGSRRLVREKVLQLLVAHEVCELTTDDLFEYVFFRSFNFGDTEEKPEKLLRPEEIIELESDAYIQWESDEIAFGRDLFNKTLIYRSEIIDLIEKYAVNWELDRIALLDRIIMEIAVTEMRCFPEIPTKVSINEAIDIAKKYSTPKSGNFINGLLDTLLDALIKEGKIVKSGRGIIT